MGSLHIICRLDQPEEGDSLSFANRILQELYPQIPNPFQRQPQNQTDTEEAFTKNEIARIMQKVPIKKAPGKNKSDIKSYRPISLLPTLGKILEKLLLERLNHHLRRNNFQHPNKYGFRTNRSTEEAILDLLDKINSAKNSNQHALMISLDIKGAFDHLQYTSIKNSLDNLKYHSNTLEILIDILSNRKVSINTSQGPETWNQQQGCPQGSCTGHAFWNLVADEVLQQDWPQGVHLQAFADDFVFLVNAVSKQEVKNLANKALQTFKTWTDKHKLEISLDKTYYLHINKNRSGPIWYSGIKWGQNNIKRASVIKYLGVLIDDKLNFSAHLSAIKNKSLYI
ncbi:Retrovirus-related Pol polyprotein from type-1 retrotransposable element R1 [Araneus ventricosus]|uniref:Retrovirus-related Pol polyprotein from type-1 retrotransposable element R1 n=1 Tax=Araneus ventricosus TaxID=182803 RepID=A0A4Y2DDJ8_ARAVE|nr:Retrovirus-related Pol polyprotein from type-1 retrotransposable element R1 [Araneus ventricosus]